MPQVSEEARDFKIFSDRVQEYVKMQRELKASLPPLIPRTTRRRLSNTSTR